jgi:EAL domain-containing protein (putative c-di-GMP-specific phosphodiesterase class I)/ActR/RegA family two-component response regulator
VSQRLAGCLRSGDTVGRLGGDEFGVILVMEEGPNGAALIAREVQDALREPFELNGHELTVTASIGITVHPDDADESETLIKYADTAMYQAKQAGRDSIRFFTTQMNTEALARLDLEIALRQAVKNREFVLHYQPKARLEDGTIAGLEALLRWERPGRGLVPPGDFIPALEESGLIVDVGSWVIDAVCAQIGRWTRSGVGPLQVSLNVAGRQLMDGDVEGDVVRSMKAHDVPAQLLELELTESTLMVNTERTIATLENLRSRGVGISIDDFGTGYSSLAYLRRFPIDKLKIDISFIREITTNADDAAISLAIIQMAHSLNMDVIAEGVETEAQLSYLRRHRCDQMQGYYLSAPLPVAALEELLLAGKGLPTSSETDASPATLLLVDDDPRVLAALQLLLGDDGYRILTATSASEGFDMLALHEIQVLLCDECMPDMTGTDFLARVKEMHPNALRIVLSAGGGDGALIASINRGEVYRYYTKPWDAAELRNNLREAFRHYWNLQDARTGWRTASARA